jgi:hypothetical protein
MDSHGDPSSERERRLEFLAASACHQLTLAGLPARVATWYDPDLAGVKITIDNGDDRSGGVYVSWAPSRDVRAAVMDAVVNGRLDDPTYRYAGATYAAMQPALLAILSAAGFSVELADTEMSPYGVKVIAERVE